MGPIVFHPCARVISLQGALLAVGGTNTVYAQYMDSLLCTALNGSWRALMLGILGFLLVGFLFRFHRSSALERLLAAIVFLLFSLFPFRISLDVSIDNFLSGTWRVREERNII